MVNIIKVATSKSTSPSELQLKKKKHIKLTEINYRNNNNSDYTEKIEELDKNFNYSTNSNHYWGDPELSTLYGTPLYEEASPAQKLALNHLFWVGQYNHTAASEANTVFYNQVTAGVFSKLSEYKTLCKMLELETEQEYSHMHAFQRIGYKTKVALLGKKALGDPLKGKSYKLTKNLLLKGLAPHTLLKSLSLNSENSPLATFSDPTLRFLTKIMLHNQVKYYSKYLQDQEKGKKSIPATRGGLGGLLAEGSLQKFFTINWGGSPFLACQYYAIRMIANMSLKNYEHRYYKYCKQLENKEKFIPAPTIVSYYHLLDESFHTTTSQLISQELYKDFPKPTAYEKFLANLTIYMAQKGVLSGLSGVMPTVFRSDSYFHDLLYRMLRSPLFGMSAVEALHWMEECLCREHEGFHVNLKFHQRLFSELRRFFRPH